MIAWLALMSSGGGLRVFTRPVVLACLLVFRFGEWTRGGGGSPRRDVATGCRGFRPSPQWSTRESPGMPCA